MHYCYTEETNNRWHGEGVGIYRYEPAKAKFLPTCKTTNPCGDDDGDPTNKMCIEPISLTNHDVKLDNVCVAKDEYTTSLYVEHAPPPPPFHHVPL